MSICLKNATVYKKDDVRQEGLDKALVSLTVIGLFPESGEDAIPGCMIVFWQGRKGIKPS